jgi:LPS-assembly protein
LKPGFYKRLLAVVLLLATQGLGAEQPGGVYLSPVSAANDWPLCTAPLPIPARPTVDVDLTPGAVHISADEADLQEEGTSLLHGNAEITRDRQQVRADAITYNQPSETAVLQGNIEYWDDSYYFNSETARLEFETDTGEFENARYVLKDNRARGQASKIRHEYPSLTMLNSVDYTTCDPQDNFWKFTAGEITLNHDKNWGSARNVVLRIKDVPVLYTPYISFPLSKERKTGFLFPSFGSTNRNGYEVQTPFYWNIAPEMDATLTPRVLSDSGLMMMGQFRYLVPQGKGELNAEYLPSDDEYGSEDRSLVGFTHNQSFADTGRLFLTYNRVSDKQYFEDFGRNINLTSTRYLERRADASYYGSWWDMSARLQDYQTVDSSIPALSRPYKRLPQIRFNAYTPYTNRQLNFHVSTEISYFDRDGSAVFPNDINGARFDLFPSISYPLHTASTYLEPKIGLRYTQYSLEDNAPLFNKSPSRVLPMFSMDSGVFFERDTSIFNKSFLQTLEPRLFYLYIPSEDQSDLPVFDTGLYDFSFDSLFREDRFTGADRMGDANQFTLAVTSRLMDQTSGKEAGYISLGQIYYLHDREVFLPAGKERDEDSSPFVAEIGTSIIDNWRLRGTLQWDPNNSKTEKLAAFAQYNPAPDKVINMGYRSRNTTDSISSSGTTTVTDIEQTEISFMWPITRQWNAVGRWYYALQENRTLDVFGGVEYDSCCWAFRVIGRRFLTNVDGDYNTGIFFQIELKGLAGIGQKTADYLRENIPGYQSEF